MKRYANTKKFLLWLTIILLLLFVIVMAWRGLRRSSDMRPNPPRTRGTEQPLPDEQPKHAPEDKKPLDDLTDQGSKTLEELAGNPLFGWPASPHQILELVEFSQFTLAYNEQHEQAAWVAYRLTVRNNGARHERYDRFMADEKVSTGSATPIDYANSGYDRGHLAPAADFSHDKKAMQESFYMSNMSPQEPAFNRGIWSRLENQVRAWAEADQELWIVTGPVLLNQQKLKKIGANQVSVPLLYYKVILDIKEPTFKIIGFAMANQGSGQDLTEFILPVDSIETLTGLDFFPLLPDELEDTLEQTVDQDQWQW